ncbi:hypothetical protein JB92DRAFT_3142760 [Gautieria morchelliformis]|nr:hypothetical protein JB92DRAFT_3142760 [Gautieria morchelliformis]
MAGAAPAIPPFDYSRFQWRQSPDDTNVFLREAFGGEVIEDFFSRFNHGEQTLYLGLHVTLHSAISPSNFLSQAREAWKALRHQVPLVAVKIAYDAAGNTLMTYRQAASSQEVADWAHRTVRLSNEPQGLDQLRYELSKVQIPDEHGTLTLLYILPGSSETSYSLLLHTSHVPFDGGGIKVLGNKLLALLAARLTDGGAAPPLHWGEEGKNLLPCVTEILGPDEDREGERYTQTLTEVLGDIRAALPRLHGFKVRSIGPGPTRRLGYTFSASDSDKILESARELGFTLNHIAHAALTLVAAFDNPAQESTPADAAFVYYGLVDTRSRLVAPYNSRDAYPGYCLGMSVIQVPLRLCPSSSISKDETRGYLVKVANIVKDQYLKQKAYPSLLAIDGQQVEMMLAGPRSGAPPPPPWIGPWYGGDGRGETYLDPVHKNSRGEVVLELDDFFVALNKTDPGPFFRVTSWKGRLMLSVDTNVAAMPADVTQGFMDQWAAILLTLTA